MGLADQGWQLGASQLPQAAAALVMPPTPAPGACSWGLWSAEGRAGHAVQGSVSLEEE